MDSADYIHQEQERQFPTEKREAIHDEYLMKKARIKGVNYSECEWCQKPVLIKDTRQKTVLCNRCESARGTIERFKTNNKIGKLNQAHKQQIANSKTKRVGSGRAFN